MPDLETFETYRWLLFSIAYRMLGSAMEAEDMVQEAYLRYARTRGETLQSPKAFLTTVITRLCLDHLKSAKIQREEYPGTWLPEPLPTGHSPAEVVVERETLSMAFLVLLERLSPIERAVFLLREVFDYGYTEIASIVGRSEASCRQHFHRAKQSLVQRRPRFAATAEAKHKLVEGFLEAVTHGDVAGLTQLLADEVVVFGDGGGKAPAVREPLHGRGPVVRLLLGSARVMPAGTRIEVADVNGGPALLFWSGQRLLLVINFSMDQGRVTALYHSLNPDKLAYLQAHTAPCSGSS
jgi:RNA polymerase sigma-70 factor (ECF subfamily)